MKVQPVLMTAIDASAAATTTSQAINVENAKKVTLLFTRTLHSSGSTSFAVTGSVDGITFVTLNMMIDNVTNAIAEGLTRVAASSLASNTSKMYALDLENFGYKEIKVVATRTTDGSATAKVLIEV